MIIRIVKMTFKPEMINDFRSIFEESQHLIRNRNGCTRLQLLQDIHYPNVFFTYSHWNSENELNDYRDSDLFKTVWSKTKLLFLDKAEAWSVEQKSLL